MQKYFWILLSIHSCVSYTFFFFNLLKSAIESLRLIFKFSNYNLQHQSFCFCKFYLFLNILILFYIVSMISFSSLSMFFFRSLRIYNTLKYIGSIKSKVYTSLGMASVNLVSSFEWNIVSTFFACLIIFCCCRKLDIRKVVKCKS